MKKKDVVALFNCCGPVRMSGERGPAHKELTMEGRESQRENDPAPAEEKIGARSKFKSQTKVRSQVKVRCWGLGFRVLESELVVASQKLLMRWMMSPMMTE